MSVYVCLFEPRVCFQRSQIKKLEGEVFRDHCQYPGHRKTNIIVTNRYSYPPLHLLFVVLAPVCLVCVVVIVV